MSIKCFLRLVLMVSTNAKYVLPFSLSVISGIACLASHFKTGSGASKAIIRVISYATFYLLACQMASFIKL